MAFLGSLATRQPRRLMGRGDAQAEAKDRLPWVLAFMLLWGLAILLRLAWLQGVEHRRYQTRAEHQHTTKLPIRPIRGELRDRLGESLAISLEVESLFCTPRVFYPQASRAGRDEDRVWGEPDRKSAAEVAALLSPVLEMSKGTLQERLLRKKPFVWVERQLSAAKIAAVKNLLQAYQEDEEDDEAPRGGRAAKKDAKEPKGLRRALKEGFGFLPESRRYYPRGSLAAQILGFTNIDGVGQLGIEGTFDQQLAGQPGELIAPRDAKNRLLILKENYTQVPVNGSSLQLSIDATIQHITEEALEEAVRLCRPTTAYAVVVDPNTGEILSMAGTPTFDPNHILPRKFLNRNESEWSAADKEEYRRELERQKAARKVHPVEDSYEPGSTMKIFTASLALEERKVHLGEKIDCMGGHWKYNAKIPPITDTHHHGVLTFEEVLWQSSNVGTAKIGIRVEPTIHYQYLRKFGFGEPSGLNFPGESAGRLQAPDRWSLPTQYTLSYGYGLSVTPLQILMAGSAIANGGKLMQPILVQKVFNDQGQLLKEIKPVQRQQVLSEETSALMREALKGVITNGTGKKAKLEGGVEAFGKTGTARKLINGAYDPKRHYASFMGFFPAEKPQYGVLVMLDDPAGDTTGGDVAAPVFKKIGDAILRYRASGRDSDKEADLKLALRDWPASESDESGIQVERGRVPDLKGLSVKAAIQRVLLVGGVPRVASAGGGSRGAKVQGQSPDPGAKLDEGAVVTIRAGD